MTTRPAYLVHQVDEKEVTVDWLFGDGHQRKRQIALVLAGWFFALLPVVITMSALSHRGSDEAGWWSYPEGFAIWDATMAILGILTVFFIVAFLVLHLADRTAARRRNQRKSYDAERLDRRLEIVAVVYADKFGPEALRLQQGRIQVEPYGDLETYELRGAYRAYGVD